MGKDEEQVAAPMNSELAAGANSDAAKLGAAADGKPDSEDASPSATLDIPFIPMTLAFRCGHS